MGLKRKISNCVFYIAAFIVLRLLLKLDTNFFLLAIFILIVTGIIYNKIEDVEELQIRKEGLGIKKLKFK